MRDVLALPLYILIVFLLSDLFQGDPDLWDKLFEVAHIWADTQLGVR